MTSEHDELTTFTCDTGHYLSEIVYPILRAVSWRMPFEGDREDSSFIYLILDIDMLRPDFFYWAAAGQGPRKFKCVVGVKDGGVHKVVLSAPFYKRWLKAGDEDRALFVAFSKVLCFVRSEPEQRAESFAWRFERAEMVLTTQIADPPCWKLSISALEVAPQP